MKNISKIFLLLFVSSSAYGQDLKLKAVYPSYDYGKAELGQLVGDRIIYKKSQPISFNQYDMEGASYVEVAHCIAGSDVAFYSNRGGGKVVKAAVADKNGKVVFEQTGNFNPAFAVNLTQKNNAGIAGNGMVDFASAKLFSLQDVKLDKNVNSQNVISCKVKVSFENAIIEVQKSADGANFKTIDSRSVDKSNSFSNITFTDDKENSAVYRLVLLNKTDNSSYITKPVQNEAIAGIAKIYPSPVSNDLTITVAPEVKQASYVVLDNAGKVLKQGKFTQQTFRVAVSDLTKGIYFIKITGNNKTETKQFIKN